MTDALPGFSLDTPPVDRGVVVSGHNFREVAPELLSPLTWSVVGAGMEQGMRALAQGLGVRVPHARPHYVAYLAFRPFHVASTMEDLIGRVPWADGVDLWDLVFGGAPPAPAPSRRFRLRDSVALARELRYFVRTTGDHERAAEQVARAEALVLEALRSGSPWAVGAAADASVSAGRTAWHVHMRTTSQAIVVAGMVRADLEQSFDPASVRELLDALAQRAADGHLSSARAGRLTASADRMVSYEVADRSDRFRPWSQAHIGAATRVPRSGTTSPVVELVAGGELARIRRRGLARWLDVALGEREASKQLGLRALHCLRLLLDAGLLGDSDPGDLALLGAHELRLLPVERRQGLIDERTDELAVAATLDVATDLRRDAAGMRPLPQRRPRAAAGAGAALAPGRCEGVLTDDPSVPDGILWRSRVEAHDVLQGAAVGVVAEYGSVLSHAAIVCRELGIPFVAGLAVDRAALGRRATLDGWTGRLTVGRHVTIAAGAPVTSAAAG